MRNIQTRFPIPPPSPYTPHRRLRVLSKEMKQLTQPEVLDLRHYSARQLRPLLEEEVRQWNERLHWDYRNSVDLLLQYLDSRVLPGLVALQNDHLCGYIFCVYEGSKALIGDVYASSALSAPHSTAEVEQRLLLHLIETLQHQPGVERIESQLLLHPSGELAAPFLSAGFQRHPRLFMECMLATDAPFADAAPHLPPGLAVHPWSSAWFQEAGKLIHRAYLGHADGHINDQYATLEGCLRFLHNIVRFPGCGVFDNDASLDIHDQESGVLLGLLLCSRVRADVGHITQICVLPEHRGRGLARALLHQSAAALSKHGAQSISLTVTAGNTSAVALYQKLGFYQKHHFDAMVWSKA